MLAGSQATAAPGVEDPAAASAVAEGQGSATSGDLVQSAASAVPKAASKVLKRGVWKPMVYDSSAHGLDKEGHGMPRRVSSQEQGDIEVTVQQETGEFAFRTNLSPSTTYDMLKDIIQERFGMSRCRYSLICEKLSMRGRWLSLCVPDDSETIGSPVCRKIRLGAQVPRHHKIKVTLQTVRKALSAEQPLTGLHSSLLDLALVEVTVQRLSGEIAWRAHLSPCTTGGALKHILQEKLGVATDCQTLISGSGQLLDDDDEIGECKHFQVTGIFQKVCKKTSARMVQNMPLSTAGN